MERLIDMLPNYQSVLDAGCGHGVFTMKMARYAKSLVGFDSSKEMINIAKSLQQAGGVGNIEFVYATTKTNLPFTNGQFDFIYNRRGPTSILNHSRILSNGGTILGIHSGAFRSELEKKILENTIEVQLIIREYKYIWKASKN